MPSSSFGLIAVVLGAIFPEPTQKDDRKTGSHPSGRITQEPSESLWWHLARVKLF